MYMYCSRIVRVPSADGPGGARTVTPGRGSEGFRWVPAADGAPAAASGGCRRRVYRRAYTRRPSSSDVDSQEVRRQWAERSGEFSPTYYAYRGPDERSEAVLDAIERRLDTDARVLELGCSSGRHLSHLYDNGFRDLHGIELNPDAIEVMAEHYPELVDAATVHIGAMEDIVGEFADDAFDAVYSVETLQHIHPDAEWVFAELARITEDLLVTVENEGEDDEELNYVNDEVPLHYRDWHAVFTGLGLTEDETRAGDRDTIRAFTAR